MKAAAELDGIAAHFDLGGISLERFYHYRLPTRSIFYPKGRNITESANLGQRDGHGATQKDLHENLLCDHSQ